MFYVPEKNFFPKEKHSLKFINKLEENPRQKRIS